MRWSWCQSVWEGWAANHPQPRKWQSAQDGLCHWGPGGLYYENFISLTLSPLTISRLLSSLYSNTLPNQITFGFWAMISEDLICILMLTQGSGSHPDPLLLTFASMLANAVKNANWLVRMDTWPGALGQVHIPLHQAGWAQLVCGLTTGHSTKDSPAVLKELHGISFVSKWLPRDNDLEGGPSQTSPAFARTAVFMPSLT